MNVSTTIIEHVFTGATEFTCAKAAQYVVNIGGAAATLQYWDGLGYVNYADSGSGFQIMSPCSGKLKITGACTFSMTKVK